MIDEDLILIDENNRPIGTGAKQRVHRDGLLHRAFSIFLVDNHGRLLLQQRHPHKYHSGSLWANSCCGHPRVGESSVKAAHRRLGEELGLDADLRLGFFARYRAALGNGMSENEFVYVYFGNITAPVRPNPDEIIDVDFLTPNEIRRRMGQESDSFTYWLKHYFHAHYAEIASHSARTLLSETV